ncbi:MAG: hypothetical protein JSS27_04430 [Planctomycetes bacterium]|nr:hypothetical protein [Planctomycetota bacterium]
MAPRNGIVWRADDRLGRDATTYFKDERVMNNRWSRLAMGVLVVAVVALMCGRGWAIYNGLGPSKDEWKLKYDVQVVAADSDTLNVAFTLVDDGRLKPIYSIDLVAFSKQTDSQGGRAYDVKAPVVLKPTNDGKRVGHVQIRKEFADRALFRILTLTVDGQKQQYAAYYDIPLNKFLGKTSTQPSLATPPRSKVTK